MSLSKKLIRQNFRDSCFKRDKYCCVKCGFKSSKELAIIDLDAHHITDRYHMPNGGYVTENGITLCKDCHIKAEKIYSDGVAFPGYSIDDLYEAIDSNYEKAEKASKTLKLE